MGGGGQDYVGELGAFVSVGADVDDECVFGDVLYTYAVVAAE